MDNSQTSINANNNSQAEAVQANAVTQASTVTVTQPANNDTRRYRDGFTSWCLHKGLTQPTVDRLETEGFGSVSLLCLLTPSDIPRLGRLPLAQELLLKQLLTSLAEPGVSPVIPQQQQQQQQSHHHGNMTGQGIPGNLLQAPPVQASERSQQCQQTTTTPVPTTSEPAALSLHALLQQLDKNAVTQPSVGASPVCSDSLLYLQQNRGEKVEYLDIVDFVPGLLTAQQKVVVPGSDGQLVFESGPRKPKLENISPHQWSAANARIMFQLINEGKLNGRGILDYLAYTVKVSQLGERYEWPTVLYYDRQYRELQSMLQFPWASDSPHLHKVYLREKPLKQHAKGGRSNSAGKNIAKGPTDPNTNKEICISFNNDQRNACKYGANCRYSHVCSLCFKLHARSEHEKNVKNQQN